MNRARELLRRGAPFLLMVGSGFAGLGYQIIWTQQCALWLGHEAAALLAVMAAFLGGLAVGSLLLGALIERTSRPVRWYAACELGIALWGLLLLWATPALSEAMLGVIGAQPAPSRQWLVAFGGTFLLFLPATAAMGGTLPAMERLRHQRSTAGRSITLLYASNTLGAVLGVLASAFWLIPALGLRRSAAVCVAFNLLCGVLSLFLFPKLAQPAPHVPAPPHRRASATLIRVALTGALGIGYEVVVVRVLSQVSEDTVYTFAILLALYLAGSAVGAAGYRRWLESSSPSESLGDRLLACLAAACLVGTVSLWFAESSKRWALDALGTSFPAAISAEAVIALVAFGPPTVVMGAVFCHLSRSVSAAGIDFGRVLGINLLAAAAAPALWGVVAIPALGPKLALLLIVFGYLASLSRRAWSSKVAWGLVAATLAVAQLAPPLTFVSVPPEGGRMLSHQEGVMATVSVVEDSAGVRRLHINNRQQEGSSATRHVDARQAWLPLLLHPAPRRTLFLGLGTGATAWAAAEDPGLEVVAVELLPEVITAASHFRPASSDDASPSRLRVLAADARRYVRASSDSYDVIISDNFHPARSGSAALYTVEHFQMVRKRLAATGLFCQWLPLHQLDLETLRSIVRSFVAVYPSAWALLASNSLDTPIVGLVARADDRRLNLGELRHRLSNPALPEKVAGLGLETDLAVLGGFVAGPGALARFSASAVANTDDHPIVAYRAPQITYAPDSRPHDRLSALLAELSIEPGQLLVPAPEKGWSARLAAYWLARDRYLESGRHVKPAARAEDMLAQVEAPLLSVLRISPDFRPAYDPLLNMAVALARSNVPDARTLLAELERIQPARPEASRLLARLADGQLTQVPAAH